jgi:ABC-type sugar transport system ATPase subunit
MMYQDLALVDHVDVPGNVFLGRELSKRLLGFIPVLDQKAMKVKTLELLDRVNIHIPHIDRPVARLSGGQRQATGVARILQEDKASLLIFDEPMAALGIQEEKKVIDLLQNLKKQGYAIMVVSHNLEHVFSVADKIAVLHTGKVAGVLEAKNTTREQIVRLVMGGGMENRE